jgi:hypothetical protein
MSVTLLGGIRPCRGRAGLEVHREIGGRPAHHTPAATAAQESSSADPVTAGRGTGMRRNRKARAGHAADARAVRVLGAESPARENALTA